MKRFYTLSMALCAFVAVFAQNVVTFEGDYFNALIDSPQYGGALIYSGDEYKWTDAGTSLSSMCDKADWSQWGMGYGWNNGCAISNYVDATATTYQGQLSVPVSNGSSNFVIVWDDNSYLEFSDGKARLINSMDVINTSYALANINKNCGDGYFFKAVATGFNGEEETGKVDIMLAEGEDVISTWTRIDLSELGAVTKVVFTFDGSDRSSYGVSTPKYFALDNVATVEVLDVPENAVTFEGDYFAALIDNPQYGGALIYSGDEYKWTDAESSLSSMCDKADWSQWGMGYGWNNGCAISNYVDATATTYQGQLSVPVSNGSKNFVIVWDDNSYLEFADGKARVIKTMDVINTSYALANINKNCGDGYFFKAVATGFNGEEETGKVDIMLAEGEDVISTWTRINLSELGAVTKVVFTFDGSDRSSYGVSTPKYFALDNVALDDATAITIAKANDDSTVTGIYSMDGKKMKAPAKGINILRMSDGTTKKMIIK